MTEPLVSVLVPVFRVEQYIERCARSVLEQTYKNIEFVFVDDATDDASIDILKEVLSDYTERKDIVHVVRHEVNKGLAAARNTAVDACHGDFVFHVDSDDWVERNAIELLVKKQQESDADIISAEAYDYKEGILTKHLTGGWNLEKTDLLKGILTYKVSTTMWRRLIRKKLYIDNDIRCDERGSGGEDFQVFPRLVYYANKVTGIDNCVYYYNKSNQQSISNIANKVIEIQKQGLVSVTVIESFFSQKEPELRRIVEGMAVRNIHYRLTQNVANRHKKGYDVFLNYMKKSDTKYWSQVHWNNPMVRLLESNFYSMILFHGFYRLLKIAKLKKIL